MDPSDDVGGFERQRAGVAALERAVELVPGDGRGDGGALAGAERVGAGRGLVAVVLAPVDEDLAGAEGLAHVRGHVGWILLLGQWGDGAGERRGVVERDGRVEG